MTQTTPERKPCGTCGEEFTVTAAGGMRSHFTDNPDFQAGPDSRKCRGAGHPPAGAAPTGSADGPQCRLCRHPVQLTANGRVRSHLTPEAVPRPCPAGSDFPLGAYPEIVGTTDGLVATLARDCGHRDAGECYDCYAARGGDPAPTMADRLKAAGDEPMVDGRTVTVTPVADDDRPQASRFAELLAKETRGVGTVLDAFSPAERARLDAVVATDHRTPEQKASDARTSQLTREVITVLEQRSPEEKAKTAARMDHVASQALGVPLDPELNHPYTDPSGVEWVHPGPAGTCEAPDCAVLRNGCTHPDGYTGHDDWDEQNGTETQTFACKHCGAVEPEGQDCRGCGHWTHAADGPDPELPNCPHPMTHRAGCGCPDDDSTEPKDPGLLVEQVRVGELDEGDTFTRRGTRMRLAERESATVVLAEVLDGPHKGRTGELKNPDEIVERDRSEEDRRQAWQTLNEEWADQRAKDVGESDKGWRTPDDLLAKMSEEIRGMDALRFDCADCKHPITPLVDQFSFDGRAAVVTWACEQHIASGYQRCRDHECRPDCLVAVGDLEFGDHFVRRGVLMRCTSSGYGLVEAVVVEGPHKGRTGELKNPAEQVERTYCRHNWVTEVPPGGVGFAGPGCEYCGDIKSNEEQETTECMQDTEARTSPLSSSASAALGTTVPAQAPGSKPPTPANAPTASPRSNQATSSEPTAKATTKGRSAAVTADQDAAAAAFLGNGRTAAPAANGSSNQAAAAAQFLAGNSGAHGEKETKRDRFGRYLIPHPDTGKEQAWTRATTFAKSISDTYALGQWGLRMALLGATVRPDIVQRAHGKHVSADKALLDELTADLKNAAGDKVAANLGTAMHSFKEVVDKAWHAPDGPRGVMDQVPPDCREDIEAYIRMLDELGLEPVPHLVEFTTVVKQYGIAGTSDNCYKVTKPLVLKMGRGEVHLAPGEYVIGDLKTGKDLSYGWQEIAIQLGIYSQGINTAGVWDRRNEVWVPDPLDGAKVRLDAGIVVHLPVDKSGKKQPAVYGIDLESGWNAAVLCERVRAWRKVRNLASPVMVSEAPGTFAPSRSEPAVVTQTTVRPASLKDRANAVTSKSEASAVWKQAKKDGLPDAEVDELVKIMQVRLAEREEKAG